MTVLSSWKHHFAPRHAMSRRLRHDRDGRTPERHFLSVEIEHDSVESARLAGAYDVKRELLGFRGELRLQVRASETQTGWKCAVLRVFDQLLDAAGGGDGAADFDHRHA
jgi:hypothetical protein